MSEAQKTIQKNKEFFGIPYGKWKGRKIRFCKSGWQLYIALEAIIGRDWESDINGCYMKPLTRERYKAIIKSIPGDPHPTCLCKDCRYHRVVKKCST